VQVDAVGPREAGHQPHHGPRLVHQTAEPRRDLQLELGRKHRHLEFEHPPTNQIGPPVRSEHPAVLHRGLQQRDTQPIVEGRPHLERMEEPLISSGASEAGDQLKMEAIAFDRRSQDERSVIPRDVLSRAEEKKDDGDHGAAP
jgi:hypothetical protein